MLFPLKQQYPITPARCRVGPPPPAIGPARSALENGYIAQRAVIWNEPLLAMDMRLLARPVSGVLGRPLGGAQTTGERAPPRSNHLRETELLRGEGRSAECACPRRNATPNRRAFGIRRSGPAMGSVIAVSEGGGHMGGPVGNIVPRAREVSPR